MFNSIYKSTKERWEEIWVIDSHAHVWDIFHPWGAWVIGLEWISFPKFDIRVIAWLMGYKQPSANFVSNLFEKWIRKVAIASWDNRNSRATLENMSRSLNDAWFIWTTCLPIPPNVIFEDLLEAKKSDNRIIPFTGIDFNVKDNSKIEAELIKDILNWAKWLKIHTILQNIEATNKRVFEVMEMLDWRDIPVLFHTWETNYCDKNCDFVQTPEFWEVKSFEDLLKAFPNIPFIMWHSWLFEVEELMRRYGRLDNVYVDTSFQSVEQIKNLINVFGTEKVMFASDWPYGDRLPALKTVIEATNNKWSVLEKVCRTNTERLMKLI